DFEVVAQVMMKFLQRLNEKIVHREPNGATPVRIASEQACAGFTRLILDAIGSSVHAENVRPLLMSTRQRPNPKWREEFVLIQHELEHAAKLIAVDDREQPALALARRTHARHI